MKVNNMKIFRDTWLIFKRSLQITLRNPVWLIFGLFHPLCSLFLYAPLLDKMAGIPGFISGNALAVYTPGLLIMIALFGTSFVGFALVDDIRSGVIERFRVSPISRAALLLGRSLRDVVFLLVQSILLLVLAYFMGLEASLPGILISFGFIVLIGLTCSACSYAIALIVKSEDALAPIINFFLVPVQLLAGITLPLVLAPDWLQNIAWFNPLSHAVTACRHLFAGTLNHSSIIGSFIIMAIVTVVALAWSISKFSKSVE